MYKKRLGLSVKTVINYQPHEDSTTEVHFTTKMKFAV